MGHSNFDQGVVYRVTVIICFTTGAQVEVWAHRAFETVTFNRRCSTTITFHTSMDGFRRRSLLSSHLELNQGVVRGVELFGFTDTTEVEIRAYSALVPVTFERFFSTPIANYPMV